MTHGQKAAEVAILAVIVIGLLIACYGYWAWSRWRDSQASIERTRHQAEVDRCKQACDSAR
jgi:nicotinamide riboside transporter PnuC